MERWKDTVARHPAGDRHGVLRPLWGDRGARHHADAERGRELHRHRLQRGTHTRWHLVSNDASGAPTLTDMGASFAIATGGVLTLFIAAAPNAGSVWVRVVDEVSGAGLRAGDQHRPAGCRPVPRTGVIRGGSVCLNSSLGVSKWLGRPFHAAAGIGVGSVM